MRFTTLVCLFLIWAKVDSLKILFYQTLLGRSHIQFSGAMIDSLVEKGHVVDKLIMEWNPSVKHDGTDLARKVIRIRPKNIETPWTKMFHIQNPLQPIKFRFSADAYLKTRKVFCEELLSQNELLDELSQENYDVGLVSLYDSCGVGILHLIGVQSVNGFLATPLADMIGWQLGIPMPPSYITDTFNWDIVGTKFNFFDRLENVFYYIELMFSIDYINYGEQKAFDAKRKDFPNLRSLIANVTFVFVNTNEILDMSRPVTAKIKYVGGIAMNSVKSLDKTFEQLLSISTKGTVIFSFGSLVKTSIFSRDIKMNFLRAFSQFPEFIFIWKYDDIEMDKEWVKKFSNVHLVEWLPQNDLLNDKRIKAFISHMGLNSYLEAAFGGVPVIGIPMFGDQMQNAESAERLGFCIRLVKSDLRTEILVDALQKVLYQQKYSEKAREISSLLAARTMTPHEVLHKSLELSAEFPALNQYLQLASAEMSAWTYFCLDVWLFLASFLILVLVVCYRLFVKIVFFYRVSNDKKIKLS